MSPIVRFVLKITNPNENAACQVVDDYYTYLGMSFSERQSFVPTVKTIRGAIAWGLLKMFADSPELLVLGLLAAALLPFLILRNLIWG